MSEKINCPKCGYQIPIDEVLIHRLQEQVNNKVAQKLAEEKSTLEKQFQEKQANILQQLNEKIILESQKRTMAEKKELESLKKQNELESKIKNQELEIERRLQTERQTIVTKAQKETELQFQLKLLEKEKQLNDQKKLIAEMQRKAHQGSMQTQGEVLELSLEELLRQSFSHDKIEPVPKGVSGADIIQTVYNQSGQPIGTIAWESKRTKNWTEEWVQKLKDDARNIKANLCVLVSETLPKDINHVGYYNGIWVCDFASVCGLATALRVQLINVSNAIIASTGKDQKMEAIYNYLCSDTFAQRVQAIVETFSAMQKSLNDEKRGIMKNWALRETHIMRLTENTVNMYSEIKGRAGKGLPEIELLELGAGDIEKPKKDNDQSALFN